MLRIHNEGEEFMRFRTFTIQTLTIGDFVLVGLSGEIRPVPSGQERIQEAAKHGFKRAIVPRGNMPKQPIEGMEVIAVQKLTEALEAIA